MADSFFTSADNTWFQPTAHSRGPWDEHACHAGPPTALLARGLELLLPDQRLTRLTVNLQRPIPFNGFSIEGHVLRKGRTVSLSQAHLIDATGKTIVTANGMHLSTVEQPDIPTQAAHIGTPEEAEAGEFPLSRLLHDKPAFNQSVEVRYPKGENSQPGATTVWMKTVPILDYEEPSAFQRICPLADCGNAFGRNAEPEAVTFMNTDLTLVLHRDPIGDWLGSSSEGFWESTGIGLADSRLYDAKGTVGRALQSLVLRVR